MVEFGLVYLSFIEHKLHCVVDRREGGSHYCAGAEPTPLKRRGMDMSELALYCVYIVVRYCGKPLRALRFDPYVLLMYTIMTQRT
jgi:hypothetical protein